MKIEIKSSITNIFPGNSLYVFPLPQKIKRQEGREIIYASFINPETVFISVIFMRGLKVFL
jgi:hypothetical protein